jgi:signal peptidase II
VALAALTAVVALVLDQAVKVLVRDEIAVGSERRVLGEALRLVHVENEGVAFGRFAGNATLVAIVILVALVALGWYFLTHLDVPLIWLPTGMLLGGALGNVLDRLREGAVTDYLKLPGWPAFNLADVCITVGVVLLLVVVEVDVRRRARAERAARAAREPESLPEDGDGAAGRA